MKDGFQVLVLARIYGTMLIILHKAILTNIIIKIMMQQMQVIVESGNMTKMVILLTLILYSIFPLYTAVRIKFYIFKMKMIKSII